MKFIVVLAAITPPLGPWSVKLFEQVSTARLPLPMQRSWSAAMTDVSFFAKCIHIPAHEIQTIPASWPFACWGLDMIGTFKPAPGNFKCVFVLIDKFSKWIEYMPLTKA
jgi:hypothetical protein